MRLLRGFQFSFMVLFAFVGTISASPAQTQGTIEFSIVRGSWLVGASGGAGTLKFHRRSYPVNISGPNASLDFSDTVMKFSGEVHNIHRRSDINGIYSSIGTDAAMAGVQVIQLRNSKDVTLTLRGREMGPLLNRDLSGMSIALKYRQM